MKRKITKQIVTSLLALATTLPAIAGGPWLHKKKDGFIQAQANLPAYQYKSMLMGAGIKDIQYTNRKVFNSDYTLYFEYGITDKLDVIALMPLKHVSTGDVTDSVDLNTLLPEGNLTGLSNPELSLKYGLLDKKVKLAISLTGSFNTISSDLEKGLATGFDANSIGLTTHIGRSAGIHYGFAEVGYHLYDNNFSDVLKARVEHGWIIKKRWIVGLTLDARISMENGSYFNANLAQTGLYPNNQSFVAIGAKVAYETEKGFGFNLANPLIPIYFKYIGFNGAIAFGAYKKF